MVVKITSVDTVMRDGYFGAEPETFPFTFLPAFARFCAARGGEVVYLQDEGLAATAPIWLRRQRFLTTGQWLSPPMRDGRVLTGSEEGAFVDAAIAEIRRLRLCDRFIQPPNQALFQAPPPGSVSCRFGTYALELEGRSEDEVFASFHNSHRRDIRQAMRRGTVIRGGAREIPVMARLHAETMQRSGMPATRLGELVALHEALGDEGVLCVVAYAPDGEAEGGLFALVTHEGAYGQAAGSVARPQEPGAIKLAHWHIAQECLRRGVRQYNFVGARMSDVTGTKLERIQEFKSRFGTTLREGYLWKMDLRPGIVGLYDAAKSLRGAVRRLRTGGAPPPGDIIDQELGAKGALESHIKGPVADA